MALDSRICHIPFIQTGAAIVIENDKDTSEQGISIKIENGTFSWGIEKQDDKKNRIVRENESLAHNLKDINLTIKKGEFVCIIGEVGSGKSSFY